MTTLYNSLLRTAHEVPSTRAVLVPLLRAAKEMAKTPDGAKKLFHRHKDKYPGTKKRPSDFYEAPAEGESRRKKDDKEKSKQDRGDESKKKQDKKKDRETEQSPRREHEELDQWRTRTKQEGRREEARGRGRERAQKFLKDITPEKLKAEAERLMRLMGEDDISEAMQEAKKTKDLDTAGAAYAHSVLQKYKKEKGSKKDVAVKKTKVKELAKKHNLSDKGLSELKAFAKKQKSKPMSNKDPWWDKEIGTGKRNQDKKKSPAEQKREFMQHTDPETRKRILKMTPAEFQAMLAAIMDDEDGGGKQARIASASDSWLRVAVLAAAHANPSLRVHVLAAMQG